MNHTILRTLPWRLGYAQLQTLHTNGALRDAYNARWNVAFF